MWDYLGNLHYLDTNVTTTYATKIGFTRLPWIIKNVSCSIFSYISVNLWISYAHTQTYVVTWDMQGHQIMLKCRSIISNPIIRHSLWPSFKLRTQTTFRLLTKDRLLQRFQTWGARIQDTWKVSKGVNFTNILHAGFSYLSFEGSFLYLALRFVLFWHNNIGAKAACKMLVKLTPEYSYLWKKKLNDFYDFWGDH